MSCPAELWVWSPLGLRVTVACPPNPESWRLGMGEGAGSCLSPHPQLCSGSVETLQGGGRGG